MMALDRLVQLKIEDFWYELPENKIAKFPLQTRDESKLLVFNGIDIQVDHFKNLATYLPNNSTLVFNNTKVVNARLFFRKETGALIEIFCLEPSTPFPDIQIAFQQKGTALWKCLLGNARRWKSGVLSGKFNHGNTTVIIKAEKISQLADGFEIRFTWEPADLTFSELLQYAGEVPLPPYLNREPVESDKYQYQTIYAEKYGSVAAPTAGLHFTDRVLESLSAKSIKPANLTLHVGAGTFKPVGTEGIKAHIMHSEQITVTRKLIEDLLENIGNIIAVGTTSVRTLESLYWFGAKLENDNNASFNIHQYDPYHLETKNDTSVEATLINVLDYLKKNQLESVNGSTRLMIAPGYTFKLICGMITNFHQPRSTLLLLIAAWLGDYWKEIYEYALNNDFRFLSYGDSCLFIRQKI